ncbi:Metal tolerance protein [Musa troglodytarum]|uniref:Metal tolerance protein n=1 Tax=Musa troglodytarum TaxID=320322 RepID=A0A9E7H671_9LILI|nr:Metal tolerance protein [Musa troglodytarum]
MPLQKRFDLLVIYRRRSGEASPAKQATVKAARNGFLHDDLFYCHHLPGFPSAIQHGDAIFTSLKSMSAFPLTRKVSTDLSHLPNNNDRVDDALLKQIEYLLYSKWVPCLEFSKSGHHHGAGTAERVDGLPDRAPVSSEEEGDLAAAMVAATPSWRLNVNDFAIEEAAKKDPPLASRVLRRFHGKHRKIAKYYKKQGNLLQGFSEMETIAELGCLAGAPTQEERKDLAKSERLAINLSNIANLILFASKVLASIESKSLVVIASTLDSLLDLLSGFILWFTAYAMKKPNQYSYPIGKNRMQPVGIVVFASVMGTLGLQVLLESGRQLITREHPTFDHAKELWMVGSMSSSSVVKFFLMLYCRSFKNEIVRAYAQDHFFDVITNSIGLVASLLAVKFYWWMDPIGAILIAVYTICSWAKTVVENVWLLIGRTAPPDFLAKLTYLIWNHHQQIKHIDTVRAYTFGSHYFAEVDIVLPADMPLSQAHDIGETLQEKVEQLPEVERAFVHIDFEFTHRPEHKPKL